MKTLSIFLSLINSLLAGVLLLASLSGRNLPAAAFVWLLAKALACLGIIATGILTWLGALANTRPGWFALSSLALVALGAATAAWTLHRAIVTGELQVHLILYGGSLMVQGAAALLGFSEGAGQVLSA